MSRTAECCPAFSLSRRSRAPPHCVEAASNKSNHHISAHVIAVFNGEKSGTKNTIDYAKKRGVEIEIIMG